LFTKRYVLITSARNEERFIENTINSVIAQSVRPAKWVIISDGSTDCTDEIVSYYKEKYEFIRLLRVGNNRERNFGSQVDCINMGYKLLENMNYEFFGNLDADISFEPNYYENILERFNKNLKLGIAGGFIYDFCDGEFKERLNNSTRSVAHGVQLFRRECYEYIGGYIPLKYGGADWYTEVMARMKGWQVEAFPELKVFHHRPTASANGILRGRFHQGIMDYSIGSHPTFEVLKCLRRFYEKPYIVGALCRLKGFITAYFRREHRKVSDEFIEFLRKEQMKRVRSMLSSVKSLRREINRSYKLGANTSFFSEL
jgi:glycosyltransferase involved in cell wall biosynthesis